MGYNQNEMGLRIRNERLKNKLTIEKLCEMLEVSPSFIGLVERGESGISLEKLYKLSEIFHVSTDYILMGEQRTQDVVKRSKLEILNTHFYDYSDEELDFVLELLKFLRTKVTVK